MATRSGHPLQSSLKNCGVEMLDSMSAFSQVLLWNNIVTEE
jgi:hypothetical protein